MSDRRPRAGDLLAAAGAVGLAGALSLNWFEPGRGGAIVQNPLQPSTTGWVALGWFALALLIGAMTASLLQLGSVVLAAGTARALAAVAGALGVAAAAAILVRLIVAPDLDAFGLVEVSRRAPAFVGLACALAIAAGGLLAWRRPRPGADRECHGPRLRGPVVAVLAAAGLLASMTPAWFGYSGLCGGSCEPLTLMDHDGTTLSPGAAHRTGWRALDLPIVVLVVLTALGAAALLTVAARKRRARCAAVASGGVAAVTAVTVVARLVDRPDLGQDLTSYATVVRWPAVAALACALLVVAGAGLAARGAPG